MLNKTVHWTTGFLLVRNRFQSVLQFVRTDVWLCLVPPPIVRQQYHDASYWAFVKYSRPSRLRMPLSSKFTVRLELPAFPIESLHMPTLLFGQGARDVRFKFYVAEMPEVGKEVSWRN